MRIAFRLAIGTAIAVLMAVANGNAETISGLAPASPVSSLSSPINITTGATDWAYYESTSGTAVTKLANSGFATAVNSAGSGGFSIGGDSQIYLSYSGGTSGTSKTADRQFIYKDSSLVSFSYTMTAANEVFTIYLVSYGASVNLSATLKDSSGTSVATPYLYTAASLPTTDGAAGSGHGYGVLTLTASGAVGETFTFTTNVVAVGGSSHNVSVQAVTVVDSVPEPATFGLLIFGAVGLGVYTWRKRWS